MLSAAGSRWSAVTVKGRKKSKSQGKRKPPALTVVAADKLKRVRAIRGNKSVIGAKGKGFCSGNVVLAQGRGRVHASSVEVRAN